MFAKQSGVKKNARKDFLKNLDRKNFFNGNLRDTGFATIPTTQLMHTVILSRVI